MTLLNLESFLLYVFFFCFLSPFLGSCQVRSGRWNDLVELGTSERGSGQQFMLAESCLLRSTGVGNGLVSIVD
jgi:hypothetical protein